MIARIFPFLLWFPRVGRGSLPKDLLAGLSGALIVLPQAVAFATIAGMPPAYGLYAAMVPAVIAALFGSSWHLVSGPTTAISLVVFAAVSPLAPVGGAIYVEKVLTLSLMVGVMQVTMGFLRLGTLVQFVSHAVVLGFTAGAAVLIGGSQLKNLVGVSLPPEAQFIPALWHLGHHLADTKPWVLATGLVTLGVGILWRRFIPRIPYMIAAMLAGSVFAWLITRYLGPEATGIRTVGALPRSLPPLSMPDFRPETLRELAPVALALTVVALTEAVGIARSIALKSGQAINGSQEFIGQGLSNMAGAFFSSYPSCGSFNRSGLNYDSGAQTPMASVFAAVFLAVTVLVVAPLAAYLPIPAMAGVLLLVAWNLIDFGRIRHLLHAGRHEAAVLILTFAATLLLQLEFAILAGVLLSLGLYLHRTSHPPLRSLAPDPNHPHRRFAEAPPLSECPQLKMLRVEGSLYFGAANHVEGELRRMREESPGARNLLVLAKSMNFLDHTGAGVLLEEERQRKAMGGAVYFYGLRDGARTTLEREGGGELLAADRAFDNRGDAIRHIVTRNMEGSVCASCTRRIFHECHEPERPGADGFQGGL